MTGAGGRGHGREDSAAAPTDSREEAAEALGDLRDFRTVEPLIASLGDRESGVREEAAEALGKSGDR